MNIQDLIGEIHESTYKKFIMIKLRNKTVQLTLEEGQSGDGSGNPPLEKSVCNFLTLAKLNYY